LLSERPATHVRQECPVATSPVPRRAVPRCSPSGSVTPPSVRLWSRRPDSRHLEHDNTRDDDDGNGEELFPVHVVLLDHLRQSVQNSTDETDPQHPPDPRGGGGTTMAHYFLRRPETAMATAITMTMNATQRSFGVTLHPRR